MDRRTGIAIGAGAILLLAAGLGIGLRARAKAAAPEPADTLDIGSTQASLLLPQRTLGDSTAPLTIYEFSDFQCPFCRDFWEKTLPAIERDYIKTGKVRLVFINFPIAQIHPNSPSAHRFAMCAAHQDKFWPYHDLLFRHQKSWEKLASPLEFFRALGDSARLDQRALTSCLGARTTEWLVQGDVQAAWNAGVQSTPTFVVNGGMLAGAAPIESWRPVLDSIYRAASEGAVRGGKGR